MREEKYDPTPRPGEETEGARAPGEVVDGSGIVVAEVDAPVAIAGVALLGAREGVAPGYPLLTARCGGTVEVDVRLEFVLLSTQWYGFGCTCGGCGRLTDGVGVAGGGAPPPVVGAVVEEGIRMAGVERPGTEGVGDGAAGEGCCCC